MSLYLLPVGTHKSPLLFSGVSHKTHQLGGFSPLTGVEFGWALPYLTWMYKQRCKRVKYIYLRGVAVQVDRLVDINPELVHHFHNVWFKKESQSFMQGDSSFYFLIQTNKTTTTSWNISPGNGPLGIHGMLKMPLRGRFLVLEINPFLHPVGKRTRSRGVVSWCSYITLRSQVNADGLR